MKGRLFLDVSDKSGRTVLKESYFTPPFKIADITLDKRRAPLHLMIMSSSPGILDEDEHEISINLEERASLVLSTQSFQRLFNMKKGATQVTDVTLKTGSSLIYLPHPVVPHEASIFKSVNRIRMEADAELLWGEVITCGRALNGENFKFSSFESLTELYLESRLLMKENIRMTPSAGPITGMGMLEGFTHQASMICLRRSKLVLDEIQATLQEYENIEFGISATRMNGFVLRVLGNAAYQLQEILQKVAEKVTLSQVL